MYLVLHRDPESLLVEHWKVVGLAPCKAFPTLGEAEAFRDRLVKEMHYDVQVVSVIDGSERTQVDSRSHNHLPFDY